MGVFDDREKSFENRFAVEEALAFKARARQDQRLGLWAAGLMGKNAMEAEAYAAAIVETQVERPDDEALFEKLRGDLKIAGVAISDHRIRRKMAEAIAEARRDLAAGR